MKISSAFLKSDCLMRIQIESSSGYSICEGIMSLVAKGRSAGVLICFESFLGPVSNAASLDRCSSRRPRSLTSSVMFKNKRS